MADRTLSAGGPVVVLGAGGHAKVVLELLRAAGFATPAVLDADPTPRDIAGAPVVGDDTALARLRADGLSQAFVAVGDNGLRRKLADKVTAAGFTLVSAVHPSAVISPSARLGAGVAVMAGAVVNADAVIADLVILNTRCAVDHDGVIGRAAHVGPGCALAGDVTVGEGAFLGVGVSVTPGRTIGAGAVIGAGAAVVRDVPPRVVAIGVPARIVRSV